MTGRQFQPGDVAMVELPQGGERVSVLVGHDPGARCWHSTYDNGDLRCLDAAAVAVRPLVVIDPEDREQVERLIRGFWANGNDDCDDVRAMTDALREFADPKPRVCEAVLVIGDERIECERDPGHVTDHRNDSVGQGVRWSA